MIQLSKYFKSYMRIKSSFVLITIFVFSQNLSKVFAGTINVSSITALQNAINNASSGDIIILANGTYLNGTLTINKNNITVKAATPGGVYWNSDVTATPRTSLNSLPNRINISGDYVTFSGFQFTSGDIGSGFLVEVSGDHNVLSQLNFRGYYAQKYIRVVAGSQYNEISYCNIEMKPAAAVSGCTIQISTSATVPGYHKIRYSSFKDFEGNGGDFGNEPIRIGLSTENNNASRTLIEYCYFNNTGLGDSESVSVKSKENIIRFCTFTNQQNAMLCFRNGDNNAAYSNFFINAGGIRVKEADNIYCYNNYFYNSGTSSGSNAADAVALVYVAPVDLRQSNLVNINFFHNTFYNCGDIDLGGSGPTNHTWANNIFQKGSGSIFINSNGSTSWLGNIYQGNLAFAIPSGMTNINPQLALNADNYYGLPSTSPAINAAVSGYPAILDIANIDDDPSLLLDISGQPRPANIAQKDVGCDEYTTGTVINYPLALSEVGPSYLGGPLPIHLISFSISKRNGFATLNWTTASELNNSHFDIERSDDGINFIKIDQVKGAGNSTSVINYAYADKNLSSDTKYYRLKQIDFDGKETISSIKAVTFTSIGLELKSTLVNNYLEVNTNNHLETTLYIFTNSGQKVFEIKAKGLQQINVSALSAGVYILKTFAGDAIKFIKQ